MLHVVHVSIHYMLYTTCCILYMLYMYLVEREMFAVPESKQSYVVSEQQVILHVCRGGREVNVHVQ